MTTTCVRCGAETDAYACHRCGIDRPTAQLAEIRDMTPAARDIAHRLASRDTGASTGKPGSQLPLDLGATARLDAVQNTLTTLARDIIETRGPQIAPTAAQVHAHPDPLIRAATWFTGQLEWLRHATDAEHEPWAATALGEIEACARIVRGIARGPADQRYLGPCGATITWDDQGNPNDRDSPCDGDVYGHPDATDGACRTCKARWPTDQRRAWLDSQVRDKAFRAAHIADAYDINVKTIRSWATDRPATDTTPARPARLRIHDRDFLGRPRYLVGDVLDLAAADAGRRASDQATRARRAAAHAGSEHAP